MPYPFVVPAGMIAVRIAGRWVLRKISDYLKQRRKEVKQRKEAEQRKGASVTKNTAKPESSMKTKKKATRTRKQLDRLNAKLRRNESELDKRRSHHSDPLRSDAAGDSRAMIEEKGGLLKDIEEFKRTLDRQDMSTGNIVQAYKRLRLWKTTKKKPLPKDKKRQSAQLKEKWDAYRRQVDDTGYIRRKFSPPSDDPVIKKLIRDDKRSVKEAYKKEVKKNRLTRKHQESKRKRKKD